MFRDPIERRIFFKNFFITLSGFVLAIIIQMYVVLEQPDPHYVFIPLIVGCLVGTLFGYNGILRRRLSLSNKAKSDFLSRMSHEFRTPLTAIIGFSQIMRHNDALTEETKQQSASIHRAGKHLLGLIEDLLEFARLEAGRIKLNIQSITVAELMEDCLAMIGPMADEHNIQIENRLNPADMIQIKVDPVRARQVIMNLLSNAVKYNKVEGKIIISSDLMPSGKWRLSVEDTGKGIAAENFVQIFDYFKRLELDEGKIEGTGIGLAISKHLAEMMDGEIGLESVLDQGSRFWVAWPVA